MYDRGARRPPRLGGIPLLPQTVEAYRLLAAMLRAYGMTEPEMRQLMTGSAKEMLTTLS